MEAVPPGPAKPDEVVGEAPAAVEAFFAEKVEDLPPPPPAIPAVEVNSSGGKPDEVVVEVAPVAEALPKKVEDELPPPPPGKPSEKESPEQEGASNWWPWLVGAMAVMITILAFMLQDGDKKPLPAPAPPAVAKADVPPAPVAPVVTPAPIPAPVPTPPAPAPIIIVVVEPAEVEEAEEAPTPPRRSPPRWAPASKPAVDADDSAWSKDLVLKSGGRQQELAAIRAAAVARARAEFEEARKPTIP